MPPARSMKTPRAGAAAELTRLAQRLAPTAGDVLTAIPALRVHRRNAPTESLRCVFPLGLALTLQGQKRILCGTDVYSYGAGESMLTTLDLTAAVEITRASVSQPYLGITMELDREELSHALTDVGVRARDASPDEAPLSIEALDEPTLEAIVRLLRLHDEPRLLPHLAPLARQELLLRLASGPHAGHLARLVEVESPRRNVAATVTWLNQHFAEPLRIDDLAKAANMSPSSFRDHFRRLTGTSPLQFQKRLRLQEARLLMLRDGESASSASVRVGYESASQFNREYRRMFGAPPRRDLKSALGVWARGETSAHRGT